MKKVLAIVLALIMALSCAAVAFAEESTSATYKCGTCGSTYATAEELNNHIKETHATHLNTCVCGQTFTSETNYLEHIKTCPAYQKENDYLYGVNAISILDKMLEFFNVGNETLAASTDFIAVIQDTILRLIDLIENIGAAAVSESDVAGAVDDLEEKVASLPLVGDALEYVHNLINTLKQKIKDLYASDAETAAEEPASTGSTSVGVVAFAAVSVAAAAAFVCTRKKEN